MVLRVSLFIAIAIVLLILVFLQYPIPQDITYHYLADTRIIFSIPNFMDVVSNVFFLVAGGMGLYRVFTVNQFCEAIEKYMWGIFFLSAVMIGFGSMYYHLAPTNNSLIWDRLPMTVAFMSLFSAILAEKISARIGNILGPIFIVCGILSVWYWHYTESHGVGDLRPYFAVQYISLSLLPLIILMFKGVYSHRRLIAGGLICYIIAKFFEHFDHEVYSLTREIIAGHTLKHFFSALGIYVASIYLNVRHVRSTEK